MSHETMSCLTQSLLSAIEEEDDGASQLDVRIGNEHSGCLQHHSHRGCAVRGSCQLTCANTLMMNGLKRQTLLHFNVMVRKGKTHRQICV